MNAGLWPFVAASLLATPWLRREAARAWLVASLAGLALLLPAASIPEGVPSPSAELAWEVPWQREGAEAPPRSELVDVTFQIEPWLLFLREELRAGRLPFWNPFQFSGAPFWSNGQSAPLFPLNWVFVLLPLPLGLLFLPWARGAIGALGAYWAARALGASERGGHLAAVAFALSGRIVAFELFPMGNALCLVPWLFLATERLAAAAGPRATGRWRAFALLSGLQLLAGHPETAVFCALLFAVYLAVRSGLRDRVLWRRYLGGWLVGGALAAPSLVPLALTLFETARWQQWTAGETLPWAVMAQAWTRMALPFAFGDPLAGSYRGALPYVGTTLFLGSLATLLAAIGAGRAAGDRRLAGLLAMAGFAVAGGFDLPGARELLDLLPVARKGLHHYLLLGLPLAVALLAGLGYDRWRAGEGRRALTLAAAGVGAALAAIWIVLAPGWSADEVTTQVGWSLLWGATLALLVGMPRAWRSSTPVALALVLASAAELVAAHVVATPASAADRIYPPTPATRFLSGRPERVAAPGRVLRPNAALAYRLFDVRGDDPLKLSRYEHLYGSELASPHPYYFTPIERWTSPWLDRLGVRWVMAPPGTAPLGAGWSVALAGDDATVFERPTAWPIVRWAESDFDPTRGAPERAGLAIRRRLPGIWEIAASSPAPRRLVVAETWDRGWRAQLDGRPLAVGKVDELLIAVDLPAGDHLLKLRYVPRGLGLGIALAAGGLALLLLSYRRRPGGALAPTSQA